MPAKQQPPGTILGYSVMGGEMKKFKQQPQECKATSLDRKPLDIKDDPATGTVEIEGLRYSYEFLTGLAGGIRINVPFVITKRKDGVVTIEMCMPKRKWWKFWVR